MTPFTINEWLDFGLPTLRTARLLWAALSLRLRRA